MKKFILICLLVAVIGCHKLRKQSPAKTTVENVEAAKKEAPAAAVTKPEAENYQELLNKLIDIDKKIQSKEFELRSQLSNLEKEKMDNDHEIQMVQDKIHNEHKVAPVPTPTSVNVEAKTEKPEPIKAPAYRFKEIGLLDDDSFYKNLKARESKGYIDSYIHEDEIPSYKRHRYFSRR